MIFLVYGNYALTNKYNNLVDKHNQLIVKYNQDLKEPCVMYNAYSDIYVEKALANGVYWPSTDFYCVWAKNREFSEIEETDRHEYCHYLIDNDPEHFCKSKK